MRKYLAMGPILFAALSRVTPHIYTPGPALGDRVSRTRIDAQRLMGFAARVPSDNIDCHGT
jgi:hypothetical protein